MKEIIEVLNELDPADDTQWTQDGLPVVDIVKQLTENTFLTRAAITQADPMFTRSVAMERKAGQQAPQTGAQGAETGDQGQGTESTETPPTPETPASQTEQPQEETSDEEHAIDVVFPNKPAVDADINDQIAYHEDQQNKIRQILVEAKKELDSTSDYLAGLYNKKHGTDSKDESKLHGAIQDYFAAQDARGGGTKSKLDFVMERKNGHGRVRPNFVGGLNK